MEQLVEIAPYIGAVIGLSLGLYAIFFPYGAARLVGISIREDLPQSISEVRATYGGLFAAGHAYALYVGDPFIFAALGAGWGGTALVRIISIFYDKASNGPNWAGVITELFLFACLFLPVPHKKNKYE